MQQKHVHMLNSFGKLYRCQSSGGLKENYVRGMHPKKTDWSLCLFYVVTFDKEKGDSVWVLTSTGFFTVHWLCFNIIVGNVGQQFCIGCFRFTLD